MIRTLVAASLVFLTAAESRGQVAGGRESRSRALEAATRRGLAGELAVARDIVDSLLRTTPEESPDLPDLFFTRATFAATALDANLDYEKIVSEFTSSPRRAESLLRLAQRALMDGDAPKALGYLQTMTRDFTSDSSRAVSGYWRARVLLDVHRVAEACEASAEALRHATVAGMLIQEIKMEEAWCSRSTRISRIYAVQVSAFAKRTDAEEMTASLRRSGLDAHVDGDSQPFRVRIGHYADYAEAKKALRDLQSRKLAGFIAELSP